jgi:ABC-type transport system involved in cytochrome c biogenesis permease subunit
MPTPGQLALLIFAILIFAIGGAASLLRGQGESSRRRLLAKQCLYWGLLVAVAVLIWHCITRGSWIPLEDNFDAMLWLGILLTAFVLYVQTTKPVEGIDYFIMPIVILLLIAAIIFGREKPRLYTLQTWAWVHRVTAYGGAVAFVVAGAVGAMYLITTARLRSRLVVTGGTNFGSLERLEHFTRVSVTLGFALLTIGLITGVVEILHRPGSNPLGRDWFFHPIVLLTLGVWVIYALVLHAPINPAFRGRRAAMLSILGLVLMIGAVIAVLWMPKTGGH